MTKGPRRSLLFGPVAKTPAAALILDPHPSGAAKIVPATSYAQFSTVNLSDVFVQAGSQRVIDILHQQIASMITGHEFARLLHPLPSSLSLVPLPLMRSIRRKHRQL